MYVYVGSRTTRERLARGKGISVYRIADGTGEWESVQLVDDIVNPSFLAFDRWQRNLYVIHGDQTYASVYAADAVDGRLRFANRVHTGGRNPVHLALNDAGRFLVVPNYGSGTLASLSIREDGTLGELVDLAVLAGATGPHRSEQPHSRPHCCRFDPAGRFLVVPDKGLDKIFVYSVGEDGALSEHTCGTVTTREVAGPRHIVFHPRGSHAYVVNELDSTVTAYRYDQAAGTLTPLQSLRTLPSTFTGNNRAAAIEIDRSGRFVYASNRGHDSIAIFSVDPVGLTLEFVRTEPTLGRTPRFITLGPDNRRLFVGNEDSDTIVSFVVDPDDGGLSPLGVVADVGSPVCMVFMDGPA